MTQLSKELQALRVFLGHQSVGQNLLDGLPAGPVAVVAWRPGMGVRGPGLHHARVGQNERPDSKLAAFEAAIAELGGDLDVAMLKFCYVDFAATTDVQALFDAYRATVERLAVRFPSLRFVHFTAPLTTVQSGPKAWVKKALGRPAWGARENVVRERYNALVRRGLPALDVFDLARLESTWPDGTRHEVLVEGALTPALVPSYSDDGGHLNAAASRRIASALLAVLAGRVVPPGRSA